MVFSGRLEESFTALLGPSWDFMGETPRPQQWSIFENDGIVNGFCLNAIEFNGFFFCRLLFNVFFFKFKTLLLSLIYSMVFLRWTIAIEWMVFWITIAIDDFSMVHKKMWIAKKHDLLLNDRQTYQHMTFLCNIITYW